VRRPRLILWEILVFTCRYFSLTPLQIAISDSGSCLRTTEVLQLTPYELCQRLVLTLKSNPTLSSDDRGHAICVLEMSLWFCGWVPSSDISCARYPLLPLELSVDAPPLASQLPRGCGRLYFSISEPEQTDVDAAMSGGTTDGSCGTISISIPFAWCHPQNSVPPNCSQLLTC
ncbi:Hypothetical protein, putative, partial [Bodo saltans]